jgi:hypothetical protein
VNCKQGDLALIISSNFNRQNIGKMVTCVRLLGPHEHDVAPCEGPYIWLIDREMDWMSPLHGKFMKNWFPDARLRPIRPDGIEEASEEHITAN